MSEDQEFLNNELRKAVENAEETGDIREEKLVFLHYHLAMLQALKEFQPCEKDARKDMTLLRARVTRMIASTSNLLRTIEIVPIERVKTSLRETQTLFREVGDLCAECHAALPQLILAKFKEIRQASR